MSATLSALVLIAQVAAPPANGGFYLDLGTYPSIQKANSAIDIGLKIIGVKTGSVIKIDSPDRAWAYIAGFETEDQAKAACAKLIARRRSCEPRPIYAPQ